MPSKTAQFRFANNGIVPSVDPSLLRDGQYRSTLNLEGPQAGSLTTRAGRHRVGAAPAGANECFMIRKLTTQAGENPAVPSTNLRYCGIVDGVGANIYRTTGFSSFGSPVAGPVASSGFGSRFSLASYSAGSSGDPWAFIASDLAMWKDRGLSPYSTLRPWGIPPAGGCALAYDAGAGSLDGGDALSPTSSQPYEYKYIYVEDDTGNKGNPTRPMLTNSTAAVTVNTHSHTGAPISVHNRKVSVAVYGTADARITQIWVYRKGGILYDAYRLVRKIQNTGSASWTWFEDDTADVDLESASLLETDNDPPVTSTVPTPISSTLSGSSSPGVQTISMVASIFGPVLPGTTVHITDDNPEDVIAISATASSITAFFHFSHASGTFVSVDAITGQPCSLALPFGQFMVVAGDPNNPHALYRSTGGKPESFPVAPSDGSQSSTFAGTPSNPIRNLMELRGLIVTLNAHSIYETTILQGSILQPSRVADRGLLFRSACCKRDQEIWFLAYDGIWSWDGGNLTCRSREIDSIFHGKTFNGILPIDVSGSGFEPVMEANRGVVRLYYQDTAGSHRTLVCDPANGDHWALFDESISGDPITFAFTDEDNGALVLARYSSSGAVFSIGDVVSVSGSSNLTSDEWSSAANDGTAITFDVYLPWFDMGSAVDDNLFEEVWAEVTNHQGTLTVDVYVNYDDSTVVDTFSIPLQSSGRQVVSLLPNLQDSGSPAVKEGFGREARAISFRIYGHTPTTGAQFSLHTLTFQYDSVGRKTSGGPGTWDNLGHPFDKKLYQLTLEFDASAQDQTVVIDTLSGINGSTYTEGKQEFALSNPVILGGGRALKTFPITDGTIVKEVRVRAKKSWKVITGSPDPSQPWPTFKIFGYAFKQDNYPEDIVAFTPWDDGGYAYDKYANQVSLEVNTNNVAITVKVQADGSDKATITVTSTETDRNRNITLQPGLSGKRWRLYVDPSQSAIVSGGGCFQLFRPAGIFRFQQADKGEVGHSFDWDDLGHPWDKLLNTVTVEYDNTGNSAVTMQVDILKGIDGKTLGSNIKQFTLSGGRGKLNVALPKDTIAKMVRIYPVGSIAVTFKQWKYFFDQINYPPDTVSATPYKEFGSPNDKNPSVLWIDADTENVAASIVVENEDGSVFTFNHTGTKNDRRASYAFPVDKSGKMWRLVPTAGVNGKCQIFDWGAEMVAIDPADIVPFTAWNEFEYPFDKIARNLKLTVDTGGVTASVALQADGSTVQTFSVNTTYTDRERILPCNSDIIGKMFRLVNTPGVNGKFKLYGWGLPDFIKEPPAVTQFDSYEQTFGIKGWTVLKQMWVEYTCASSVVLTIYRDGGVVFYQVVLPARATRSAERFYPPSELLGVLNKTKTRRLKFTAATPFKLYLDSSGLELIVLGADRRQAYFQAPLSQFMQIPI